MGREESPAFFAWCSDCDFLNEALGNSMQSTLPGGGPARRYDLVLLLRWERQVQGLAVVFFFVAHAVRARGSDGHQNVCGRSTILKLWENRWKCKRLDVLNEGNKPNKHPNPTNNQTSHPEKKKTSSELSETKPTLSEQIEPSEHSVLLHDDIAKFRK